MLFGTIAFRSVRGTESRLVWADKEGSLWDAELILGVYLRTKGFGAPENWAKFYSGQGNLTTLIQLGAPAWDMHRDALAWVKEQGDEYPPFSARDVQILPPLVPTSLRDFQAFEEHVKSGYARRNQPMPKEWYDAPVYYKGNPCSVIGQGDVVPWPRKSEKLDFELELACIVGKSGKNIPSREARNHIFGYTILNDFSARDLQARETGLRMGPTKGKDFASAIGPWIATSDEFSEPMDVEMVAYVNDQEWCRQRSGGSYWSFEEIIEYISQDEPIAAGDLLGGGCVPGGSAMDQGRAIETGDRITLSIEGVGSLTNTIGRKAT